MTKTQALYYFGAVIIITLLAYLYTTVAEAPTVEVTLPTETESIL